MCGDTATAVYIYIGKQYNVMVTCNAHNLVIGSSNLSTAL